VPVQPARDYEAFTQGPCIVANFIIALVLCLVIVVTLPLYYPVIYLLVTLTQDGTWDPGQLKGQRTLLRTVDPTAPDLVTRTQP